MRKVMIVFALITLCGCARTVYVHDTKNARDFERDKYECQHVAAQTASNWGAAGNPFIMADDMNKCLQLKYGWRPQAK